MKKLLFSLLLLSTSSALYAYEEGDNVCVKIWNGGKGYCGIIETVTSKKYKIEMTSIDCGWAGCNPSEACSGGKRIGTGAVGGGTVVGDTIWAERWCAN